MKNHMGLIGRRLLMVCGLAVTIALPACRTTWQTPLGPITTEPVAPGPGTTVPNPGTPGQQLPNPASPGREVTGYDTDGDGLIDLIWDPVTKQWYRVTPIRVPNTNNPTPSGSTNNKENGSISMQLNEHGTFTDPSGQHYERVRPIKSRYKLAGCQLGEPPMPWGTDSAEEFLRTHGLDLPSGETRTGDLIFKHSFDTEGEAEVTVFWSTAYGVPNPEKYNLCADMHGLPSETAGAPAAMQIHVLGNWDDVARWLVSLGIDQIEHNEAGFDWTLTATPDNTAVDVLINGVFYEQIKLY